MKTVCAVCGVELEEVPSPRFTSLKPAWRDADGRFGCQRSVVDAPYRPHHPDGWVLVFDKNGHRWDRSAPTLWGAS